MAGYSADEVKKIISTIIEANDKAHDKETSLLKLTLEVVQRYHRGDDPYDYSKMADVGQQMGEDWEFVDELITKALE